MSLQLNLQLGPILENPLHDIRIRRCTLDGLSLRERGPEGVEGLQLDEVPDGAEGGGDDG